MFIMFIIIGIELHMPTYYWIVLGLVWACRVLADSIEKGL